MAQVCVDRNMGIDGGVLSVEPWSLPRHVYDSTFNSVGDGDFTQLTTPPGKLMVDSGIQTWASDSPLPCRVLFRMQRGPRWIRTSNPNAASIRDRYTVTTNGTDPRVPDTSTTFQGQTGAAVDFSAPASASPFPGVYWVYEDAAIMEDWLGPIEPGGSLKFWYRCYLWTPPPWSNNANNGAPTHGAQVGYTRVQLIAFPEQDSAVMS